MTVIEDTSARVRLRFELGNWSLDDVERNGRVRRVVSAPGMQRLKRAGSPALPVLRENVLLHGAGRSASLHITSLQVEAVPVTALEVSAGFVERDSNPAPGTAPDAVPGSLFPAAPAYVTRPMRIRALEGIGVVFAPFQYDSRREVLVVTRAMEVEVVGDQDRADGEPDPIPVSPDLAAMALQTFTNASPERLSVTPPGPLLIVAADDLAEAVADFAAWKRRRGLNVTVARYPADTGTGKGALDAYIGDAYEQSATEYVIIVGDSTDVPVHSIEEHPSDTLYTLTSGTDEYHDMFISRVPVSAPDRVRDLLGRVVAYERDVADLDDNSWLAKACFVASDEGALKSAFGLDDWEILDEERDELLAGDYTVVDRIYDPDATATQVVDCWNAGCGLVYYLGHGTETAWNTTGFGLTHADQLANGSRLPLVINGNCKNGNFTRSSGDCLAEAMLKSGSEGSPAGAIGVIAATTAMDWDPPIVMMRHITESLVGETYATAGALHTFAVHEAMQWCEVTPAEGQESATKIMQQTHLLGDCTLGVRTGTPRTVEVSMPDQLVSDTDFTVAVTLAGADTAVQGAVVCITSDTDLQETALTNAAGSATLVATAVPLETASVTVTVYAPNIVPVQTQVPVNGGTLRLPSQQFDFETARDWPFSHSFAVLGGAPPYVWSLNNAPDWLSIAPDTGEIAGTPTALGDWNLTIHVQDAELAEVSAPIRITAGDAIELQQVDPPVPRVDTHYEYSLPADGSFPPFVVEVVNGTVPAGLSISAAGAIRGIPERAGTYPLVVRATDAAGFWAEQSYTLQVASAATLEIVTDNIPALTRTQAVETVLEAAGGSGGGYAWSVSAGELPPGLELAADGSLQGIPTEHGVFGVTASVSDDSEPPMQTQRELVIRVLSGVYFTESELPHAALGIPYETDLPVAGSYPPFAFVSGVTSEYVRTADVTTFAEIGINQDWYGDEQEWQLDFGFAFPFFGQVFHGARVTDNGLLILSGDSPEYLWDASEENLRDHVAIAPFWTDLQILAEYPDTGIFVEQDSTAITIRWRGRDYHTDDDVVEFAVTLTATGKITFHYGPLATTNRVVVGISPGTELDGQTYVELVHLWRNHDPQYLEGWSEHDDISYQVPQALPAWLSVTPDGTLTGTPAEPGEFTFTVTASDAQGYSTDQQFALTVTQPLNPDSNGDGAVEHDEILAFVQSWADGLTSAEAVQNAVNRWRLDGIGPARERDAHPCPQVANSAIPRNGPITVLTIDVTDNEPALAALVQGGFDVAGVADGHAQVYATQDERQRIRELGLTILDERPAGAAVETQTEREDTAYHTSTEVRDQIDALAAAYPDLCRVEALGESLLGTPIRAVKIAQNVTQERGLPEVRISGAIHGDERLATELALRWTQFLLHSYGDQDATGQRVRNLLATTDIWVVPTPNPDGLDNGSRYNHAGLDLNRDFPDGAFRAVSSTWLDPHPDTYGRQPETAALMRWNAQRRFALALDLHTGAVLACYPFGSNPEEDSAYTATQDDDLFRELALDYTAANTWIRDTSPYTNGVINAADWYWASGELMDWTYRRQGTLSLTIELRSQKSPPIPDVDTHWDYNREAFLQFAESATRGIGGFVTDADTGAPLAARIRVGEAGAPVFSHPQTGAYRRILKPGVYDIGIDAPGYLSQTAADVEVDRAARAPLDVALTPAPHTVSRNLAPNIHAGDGAHTVTVTVDVDNQAPPSGLIVHETLPRGFAYVPGSTVLVGRRNALPDPRIDAQACSWILWGDAVSDLTFSFRAAYQGITGTPGFDGSIRTLAGSAAALGETTLREQGDRLATLDLQQGWNLVSLPIAPDCPDATALVASLPGQPPLYEWRDGEYQPVETLEALHGYWVFCEAAAQIQCRGRSLTVLERTLEPGWTVFGPATNITVENTRVGATVYSWTHGDYTPVDQLQQTRAYWVWTEEPTEVILGE